MSLKFNKNGKFRILQISDIQDTKKSSVDTLNFLCEALKSVKPDLIVLTGDQVDVLGLWGKGEAARKNVRKAILDVLSPIRASGIPFMVTFGNHDCQTGVPNAEQVAFYKECSNCIGFENLNDGRPDAGTFNQLVLSSDGTKPVMNIYMVDSNSSDPQGGAYDMVHDDQIEWYKNKSDELKKLNGGKVLPSILFQHIPVWEMYEVLKEVPKGTKGAMPAYRSRRGKYFSLNEDFVWYNGTYGEAPSVPERPCEQFNAVLEKGDVFAMYFGHDHYNSFVGKYKGIDLGYCPGAGYNTYGLNPRGMRVFDFDEKDVTAYKTSVIRVDDLYKKPLYQPVKNFVLINAPSTADAAVPFAGKCIAGIIVAVILFILLSKVSKIAVAVILAGIAGAGIIYGIISLIRNNGKRRELLAKLNGK